MARAGPPVGSHRPGRVSRAVFFRAGAESDPERRTPRRRAGCCCRGGPAPVPPGLLSSSRHGYGASGPVRVAPYPHNCKSLRTNRGVPPRFALTPPAARERDEVRVIGAAAQGNRPEEVNGPRGGRLAGSGGRHQSPCSSAGEAGGVRALSARDAVLPCDDPRRVDAVPRRRGHLTRPGADGQPGSSAGRTRCSTGSEGPSRDGRSGLLGPPRSPGC